jgi:hypothetical protein
LVAVTVRVWLFPLVNDGTTIGLDGPDARPEAPPTDDSQVAV